MADDFSNLRDFKESLAQSTEKGVDCKQIINRKRNKKVCFIITKSKKDSWVEDLYAQAQHNRIDPVYH